MTQIHSFENESLADVFVMSVFFAPLIETLVFQLLVIELTLLIFRIFRLNYGFCFSIVLSSILFGLTHSYNIYYIGYTMFSGAVLAFFYLIARNRKDMNGYLVVTIVHAVSNFFAFILNYVLNF